MVDREAVLQAVRAARVLGDVAADRADLLARRIGRVVVAVPDHRLGDLEVRHARLDDDALGVEVDLEHAVHPRERDDDARRRPAARRPRAPSRRRGRRTARRARDSAHDRLHLLGRLRKDDERGHDPVPGQAVALVGAQLLRLVDHRARRKQSLQYRLQAPSVINLQLESLDERARQGHACQSIAVATAIPRGVEVLADAGRAPRRARRGDPLGRRARPSSPTCSATFGGRREELLAARTARQARLLAGELPDFLEETRTIREDDSWRVAEAPPDLQDRRVEITGPTDRKMVINALNSGARVFMADFEDANSPTWRTWSRASGT